MHRAGPASASLRKALGVAHDQGSPVNFRLASGKRIPQRAVVDFGIEELEPRRRRFSQSPSVRPGQAATRRRPPPNLRSPCAYTRCMSGPAGDRVQETPAHIAVALSIARTRWSDGRCDAQLAQP